METSIPRFLRYLKVERNSSELTIKSYREDLELLYGYLCDSMGKSPAPSEITPLELRTYVAALHDAGYAKSSISRRLASLRCLLYTSPSPRDGLLSRMPSSA